MDDAMYQHARAMGESPWGLEGFASPELRAASGRGAEQAAVHRQVDDIAQAGAPAAQGEGR